MMLPGRRTQPCEAAVPGVPPTLARPCSAIWPGPPSKSWNTSERALNASANGAPTAFAGRWRSSSTKNSPSGVGVDGLPTTALATSTEWPLAVDGHRSRRRVDDEVPRGRPDDRVSLLDPAGQSVRAAGQPHLEPLVSAWACPFGQNGQGRLLARERPVGQAPIRASSSSRSVSRTLHGRSRAPPAPGSA